MTSHRIFLFWCLAAELVHGTLRSAALSQRAQTSGRLRAARSNFCMLVCDGGSSGSRMWKFKLDGDNFDTQAKVGPTGPPIHQNVLPTAALNETGWNIWTSWLKKLKNPDGCQVRIFATGGLRTAVNQDAGLIQKAQSVIQTNLKNMTIPQMTDIDFKVLTPGEEAHFEFQGAAHFEPQEDSLGVVGIGGKSTQITVAVGTAEKQILAPVGCVNLPDTDPDWATFSKDGYGDISEACAARHWDFISGACDAASFAGLTGACFKADMPKTESRTSIEEDRKLAIPAANTKQTTKHTTFSKALAAFNALDLTALNKTTSAPDLNKVRLVQNFLTKLSKCASPPLTVAFRHVGTRNGREIDASPATGFFFAHLPKKVAALSRKDTRKDNVTAMVSGALRVAPSPAI